MLLRNYDNIMSANGLLAGGGQFGSEFGSNNLTIKYNNGQIAAPLNYVPFKSASSANNNAYDQSTSYYGTGGNFHLFCSANKDTPDYNDTIMTNLCDAKYVTHYYEDLKEIQLENGKRAWKRSYKKLYSANKKLQIGSVGVCLETGNKNTYVLLSKEELPEILEVLQYTNFELSFTTIVTQNPNEPPKTEYQTEVTILDEGTDA